MTNHHATRVPCWYCAKAKLDIHLFEANGRHAEAAERRLEWREHLCKYLRNGLAENAPELFERMRNDAERAR